MKPVLNIGGFSLFILLAVFLPASVLAAPFAKPYSIGLRDISLEGDLNLQCHLKRVPFSPKFGVDVWLEHKTEALDYGEARSRFILHPFETGVFRRDQSSWRWIRPGGGELVFSDNDVVDVGRVLVKPRAWSQIGAPVKFRAYERNSIQFWNTGTGWQIICDEGWELRHYEGVLQSILTPDGTELTVSASGKFISSISSGSANLVQVTWRQGIIPVQIKTPDTNIGFKPATGSSIGEIADARGMMYAFSYYESGLVKNLEERNRMPVPIVWGLNSPQESSEAGLPYRLLKCGDATYSIARDGGQIRIRAELSDGTTEQLDVVKRYGRILKIEQRNSEPDFK